MKICVDAGHTKGVNTSPVLPEYHEGTQMFYLSQYLKAELEKRGFEVILTRKKITDDPPIAERGRIAGKNNCDLMISLHSNSPAKSPDGTYDPSKKGVVPIYSLALTDMKARAWNKDFAYKLGVKIGEVMGNGVFENRAVYRLYPNTTLEQGIDYYGVLRNSVKYGCKHAVIMEHGFHTNPDDARWLMSDDNLKALAKVEAKFIYEYLTGRDETFITMEFKQLRKGDICADVKLVQTVLNERGYFDANKKRLDVDGDFGEKTDYAVRAFQKDKGLAVDGIVGKNTYNKLLKFE